VRFHLDTEQITIQDSVRGVLEKTMPRDRLHAFLDGEEDFSRDSWQAMMELGIGGTMIPEEEGGSGLGLLESALICEAIGGVAAPGPYAGQMLTALSLCRSAEEVVRSKWLAKIVSGEQVAALAFGRDWLPVSWDIEFQDGRVFGEAPFVESAASATVFLVGLRGGGLALAESGGGVVVAQRRSTDRTRKLSKVRFEGAKAALLFPAGSHETSKVFDAALVLLAADALGGAQKCLDMTLEYVKIREQFGQPVGQFQAIKHQLASMALDVEPARALVWYAAHAFDADLPDASRAAALAKAHLCDRYTKVTRDAVAVHGGIGYTWDYGLNIWFRRSVFDRAVLGAPAVHRRRAADLADW
jgi:alkylation response protein AidB-like acyl-CoA dehydrogenase